MELGMVLKKRSGDPMEARLKTGDFSVPSYARRKETT